MGKKGREKIRVLLVLIFWGKKVGKKLGYFRISELLILENYGINYNSNIISNIFLGKKVGKKSVVVVILNFGN